MISSLIIQSASFSEDEIEVSNILLNLKQLIEESESQSSSSSKKRRIDRNLGFNSPSPNSVQRNSHVEEDETDDDVEIEPKSVKLKSKEISSDTKTREELISNIEKLTRNRELLRGEVEKVQSHYNRQKAYNLELKAMREKVMTNSNGQEPKTSHMLQYPMGSSSANRLGSMNHTGPIEIPYPMGQLPQAQPIISSANGLGFMNYTGPIVGIPNLNVFRDIAERKAQYREARRMRMIIVKELRRLSGFIRPPKRR